MAEESAVATSSVRDVPDTVRPYLDHVFLTVNEETLDAITGCDFLVNEEFGRYRVKEATSTLIGPYRTANVAGESTFIEFFPDHSPPFPGTRLGLVFSFDRPGSSPVARQRLTELAATPVSHELVRRMVEGHDEPQPWYHLLRPDFGPDSPFTLFLSEITPEYFARLGAQPGPGGTQDRAAYLAAAMKAAQAPEHYLHDVVSVTLRLRPDRAKALLATLETLGYQVDDTLAHGPDVDIEVVIDDSEAEGLLGVRLRLTRSSPQIHVLGDSTLRLSPGGADDTTAVWDFTPTAEVGLWHG